MAEGLHPLKGWRRNPDAQLEVPAIAPQIQDKYSDYVPYWMRKELEIGTFPALVFVAILAEAVCLLTKKDRQLVAQQTVLLGTRGRDVPEMVKKFVESIGIGKVNILDYSVGSEKDYLSIIGGVAKATDSLGVKNDLVESLDKVMSGSGVPAKNTPEGSKLVKAVQDWQIYILTRPSAY